MASTLDLMLADADALDYMLSFLEAPDVAALASTCTVLYATITSDERLWRLLYAASFRRPLLRGACDEALGAYQLVRVRETGGCAPKDWSGWPCLCVSHCLPPNLTDRSHTSLAATAPHSSAASAPAWHTAQPQRHPPQSCCCCRPAAVVVAWGGRLVVAAGPPRPQPVAPGGPLPAPATAASLGATAWTSTPSSS